MIRNMVLLFIAMLTLSCTDTKKAPDVDAPPKPPPASDCDFIERPDKDFVNPQYLGLLTPITPRQKVCARFEFRGNEDYFYFASVDERMLNIELFSDVEVRAIIYERYPDGLNLERSWRITGTYYSEDGELIILDHSVSQDLEVMIVFESLTSGDTPYEFWFWSF